MCKNPIQIKLSWLTGDLSNGAEHVEFFWIQGLYVVVYVPVTHIEIDANTHYTQYMLRATSLQSIKYAIL